MKSRKVLLGLIVGFCVCLAGTATAQTANFQSNKLVEIGPDNIGGRVTSVVAVNSGLQQDRSNALYAGAASGGLYIRHFNDEYWHYLPCYVDGKELTLPISCMARVNDSLILIGTGESYYNKASNASKMAAMGRGLFLFNIKSASFTRLNQTNPNNDLDANFASVNQIALMNAQGSAYIYIATPKGLFRWVIAQQSDWTKTPQSVFQGDVRSIVVSKQFNRAFFSCKGGVYKISDVINGEAPVNITGSCEGFGTKTRYIDLALAPSDESYLYAMASDANGLMRGLYLTRNTNSWLLLSTSTVTPFTSAATAKTSGALAVSPIVSKAICISSSQLSESAQ